MTRLILFAGGSDSVSFSYWFL